MSTKNTNYGKERSPRGRYPIRSRRDNCLHNPLPMTPEQEAVHSMRGHGTKEYRRCLQFLNTIVLADLVILAGSPQDHYQTVQKIKRVLMNLVNEWYDTDNLQEKAEGCFDD